MVVFSGGQDSTVCLAWALERFPIVETIGFDYRQRHSVEMECRPSLLSDMRDISPKWGERIGKDHVLDLGLLGEISETALTGEVEIEMSSKGLPNTFVPGRNILFLTFAGAVAYRRGLDSIVIGVCETDYSGYPDCRDDTIKAVQVALNLGMEARFALHSPLMWITKAQTWQMAEDLGGEQFIDLIKHKTHTCYLGDRDSWNDWGYGCGSCSACELRAKGYEEYLYSHL